MARKIPLRKCIGCGEMKNKKELIRVVRTKDDEWFIDKTGKANGRGAYLCDQYECLEMAIKSKGLERSFKTKIPNEIYESIKKEFEDHE